MSETTNDSRVKGYNLSPPSKESAMDSLARIMEQKDAEKLWESACITHNILSTTNNLDELKSVFEMIAEKPGTIGVIGKSLLIRINSYKILNRKQNG